VASPETAAAPQPSLGERLRQRQAVLVHRSTVLRERLARHGQALGPLWQGADSARRGWRWVRAHPWVPALVAGWLLVRRPRRLWAAALLGWRGWRWWRRYGVALARWLALLRAQGAGR